MSESAIINPLHSETPISEPRKPLKRITKKMTSALSNESEDIFDPLTFNTEQQKAYNKTLKARENYENAQDIYRKKYEKAEEKYNKALDKYNKALSIAEDEYNKALSIAEDEYNKALADYRSLFPTTKGGKTRRVKSRGRKTRKYR